LIGKGLLKPPIVVSQVKSGALIESKEEVEKQDQSHQDVNKVISVSVNQVKDELQNNVNSQIPLRSSSTIGLK